MPDVHKTTLANGIRIVSQEQPYSYSTAVGIWLDLGSRDEDPDQAGLSHFLEHMAFKGTKKRSLLDIARQIDRMGGNANAFTSKEYTCFHGRAINAQAQELIDLLTDIAFNLIIDNNDLVTERGVILQEIASMEDAPDDLAFVLWQEDFWPSHPLGQPILGRTETVEHFLPDDLRGYMEKHHTANRILVAATGGLKHDELLDILTPSLNNLRSSFIKSQRLAPVSSPGMKIVNKDTEQEHLVLGVPGLCAAHPRRFELALLNLILGGNMSSRLFQEIREHRGLAYSVYSFLNPQADSGSWNIYMAVPVKGAAEALQVVRDELARLRQEPITDEELNNAKQSLHASILLAAEDMESRASRMARNEFTFGRDISLKEISASVELIRADNLCQLAGQLWNENELRLLALGPAQEKDLLWK
ncbi:MAG: insulinase family protein [Desulfarculales bacterium]|jgi:predicted Zn-dependent peptidase|nr:insulinase family protein [Desulfarculales bacterium]